MSIEGHAIAQMTLDQCLHYLRLGDTALSTNGGRNTPGELRQMLVDRVAIVAGAM